MNHDEGLDQGNPYTEEGNGYCLECQHESGGNDFCSKECKNKYNYIN
jgi:hypothetical protein|tara:strand:- start:687 stop:827 length:141 start_codon:yes stop_codon:yes gene_type:complete